MGMGVPVMSPADVTFVVPPTPVFSAEPVSTKVTPPVTDVSSIDCFEPVVTSGPVTVIEAAVILIVKTMRDLARERVVFLDVGAQEKHRHRAENVAR